MTCGHLPLRLLSQLDEGIFRVKNWGISSTWCRVVERYSAHARGCVLVDERCDTSNGGEAATRQASQIRERSRRWIRVGQRGQAQLAYYESLGLFDHALEDVPDGLAGDSALYQLWRAPVAERLADGGVVTLLQAWGSAGRLSIRGGPC